MRHLIFSVLISISLAGCSSSENSEEPVISLAYNPRLDAICSLFRGGAIRKEWETELTSRQDEFENLWKMAGPKLIEATENITKVSFPSRKYTARLTLCDLPSQSILGISVNMRYSLDSFTQTPVPMRYKVDTLFHELLHKVLAEYPVNESIFLKQYASEPGRTREHIHLLALQKAILLTLNEPEALKSIIDTDSQLPGGYYKRAWEIVNATDTEYLKYVAEISQ